MSDSLSALATINAVLFAVYVWAAARQFDSTGTVRLPVTLGVMVHSFWGVAFLLWAYR